MGQYCQSLSGEPGNIPVFSCAAALTKVVWWQPGRVNIRVPFLWPASQQKGYPCKHFILLMHTLHKIFCIKKTNQWLATLGSPSLLLPHGPLGENFKTLIIGYSVSCGQVDGCVVVVLGGTGIFYLRLL